MCKDCCCPPEVGVEDVIVAEQAEEIGYYWDPLTGDDQKTWYAAEMYNRYMYGIRSVDDDALEELRSRDRRKAPALETSVSKKNKKPKYIQGDSRYDLLSTLTY